MFARLAPLILFVLPVLGSTLLADLCDAGEIPLCCSTRTENTNLLKGVEATFLNVKTGKHVQCMRSATDEIKEHSCIGRKIACCSLKSLMAWQNVWIGTEGTLQLDVVYLCLGWWPSSSQTSSLLLQLDPLCTSSLQASAASSSSPSPPRQPSSLPRDAPSPSNQTPSSPPPPSPPPH
ncbi:hypothetical protein H2248_011906, partial [Termitomyces sp. 'cryptogamus']